MPHTATYSGKTLRFVKLLSTENKDICVNLVMPVINTNLSSALDDFSTAKTWR